MPTDGEIHACTSLISQASQHAKETIELIKSFEGIDKGKLFEAEEMLSNAFIALYSVIPDTSDGIPF